MTSTQAAVFRRVVPGLLAGASAGVAFLTDALGGPTQGGAVGALLGAGYTLLIPAGASRPGTAADRAMTAAALGLPLWGACNVLLLPSLAGGPPRWTAGELRALFPALVGWMIFGFSLGLLVELGAWLGGRFPGTEPLPASPSVPPVTNRVVVLGGGFAGVAAAESLEGRFRDDPTVSLTLVSETNALLFTPMLAEVAASSLEPTHISAPLRSSLKRTRVVRGRVAGVDLERRTVSLEENVGGAGGLGFDHLVLALGAVSNYLGNESVERHALDFKTLADAIRIRNHVIACFDRADAETDPGRRRALLTFVIAGGGFSGAELAGGLNDFARGILADYPNLSADDLRVVLVHSRERILPELPESLAGYALGRMRARGVTFKLNTRVASAGPGTVTLHPAEEIATETLVWTAGTAPSPVLKDLPVERDKRGAVVVASTLAVPGHVGVWALGDCASIPDATTGKPCPPTAQFAIREAPLLARNLNASLCGKPLRGFHFSSLGTLCVVGHHTACADVKGLRFSGLFAWLLWRGIYWVKLPGLERKVRVLADWGVELFFPRDIVQTLDFEKPAASRQP